MELEDHLGDIVRKARTAAGISIEAAARAAGCSGDELESLERSGRAAGPLDLAALATQVGLAAAKLISLAEGWKPRRQDLRRWRELRQITTIREGNCVNAFLAWDALSREAALFDTGWEEAPIAAICRENRLELKHLFLTHGHRDHVAALNALRESSPGMAVHRGVAPPATAIALGNLRIISRPVPGHAEDGMIYVLSGWAESAPAVAVIGDTIFAGSLARGFVSTQLLREKVLAEIFTLPPDTLLCPGHGPVTTVAEERAHNPFFGF